VLDLKIVKWKGVKTEDVREVEFMPPQVRAARG
jgi:hypothetical protein